MGLSPGTETGINQPESKREILSLVSLGQVYKFRLGCCGRYKEGKCAQGTEVTTDLNPIPTSFSPHKAEAKPRCLGHSPASPPTLPPPTLYTGARDPEASEH